MELIHVAAVGIMELILLVMTEMVAREKAQMEMRSARVCLGQNEAGIAAAAGDALLELMQEMGLAE
ncbi:hypothetical protein MKW92_007036, partial [Papaver armeniacum]